MYYKVSKVKMRKISIFFIAWIMILILTLIEGTFMEFLETEASRVLPGRVLDDSIQGSISSMTVRKFSSASPLDLLLAGENLSEEGSSGEDKAVDSTEKRDLKEKEEGEDLNLVNKLPATAVASARDYPHNPLSDEDNDKQKLFTQLIEITPQSEYCTSVELEKRIAYIKYHFLFSYTSWCLATPHLASIMDPAPSLTTKTSINIVLNSPSPVNARNISANLTTHQRPKTSFQSASISITITDGWKEQSRCQHAAIEALQSRLDYLIAGEKARCISKGFLKRLSPEILGTTDAIDQNDQPVQHSYNHIYHHFLQIFIEKAKSEQELQRKQQLQQQQQKSTTESSEGTERRALRSQSRQSSLSERRALLAESDKRDNLADYCEISMKRRLAHSIQGYLANELIECLGNFYFASKQRVWEEFSRNRTYSQIYLPNSHDLQQYCITRIQQTYTEYRRNVNTFLLVAEEIRCQRTSPMTINI
jgi:hypothetical protein